MKTSYIGDIKVMSTFRQTIQALNIIINILRVLAVAFIVLQTITIMRDNKV